ncbi:c-type cytochrome [Alloacidobacterium dinghuense]|uniref:C-type cytochrome n=1 Tax=Alloacidobacterium dinghuense TaxID=2763107 RepID=A0A7G8BPE5_9BACT|nr:c-type cytochrome [Alloacidobacterium dinghuense]QNI34415.1 c-type cytochrome [Alloacidobacterium dinghuense]
MMRHRLVQTSTAQLQRSAARFSGWMHSAFMVSFSGGVLILAALIAFPRISRADGDSDRGKQLFEKRCTGCHSLDQDKEGPGFEEFMEGRQVKFPASSIPPRYNRRL